MEILITGAAGFIGSNLAKNLISIGHNVTGVDNLSYGLAGNIKELENNKKFTFILGDITNPFIVREYQPDVLVHLASQKIPRYTNAYRTLEENNLMLKNVVNKWITSKCKIIFASTSDVYGKNEKIPFTEDSNLVIGNSKIKRWAYAVSKIYGEQYIIANADEHNLKYTIVRFFGSYGENQNLTWWGGPQSVFISNALNNEEMELHGDGKQTRTFTYIGDTVDALTRCILNPKSDNEIYNIAGDPADEISIYDLGSKIWKMIRGEHDKIKIKYVPYESFGKYEDVMRRVPDISKICKELDFMPQYNLDMGLKKTIEWQKKIVS